MKKYLTVLFLLLFVAISYGQNYSRSDSLKSATDTTASDTTYTAFFGNPHEYLNITYADTGASYADTILVYTSAGTDTSTWVRTGLLNLLTNSVVPYIVNADSTRKYQVLDKRAKYIKLVLSNVNWYSGRLGEFTIEVK